ncbi:S8 family peptidase [Geoalkalibacter sp.]|uniref:S8 family peptidase n=1 Tax=Geoalkalibacter sp. TaxID=3041440 RepID=UPI00272DF6C7|nr:S8 family peptidase [Geoalkalibacter sp.]
MKSLSLILAALTLFLLSGAETSAAAPAREYLVGFHDAGLAAEKAASLEQKRKLKKSMRRLPVISVVLDEAEANALREDPGVAYVQENVRFQAIAPMFGAEYDTSWGVTKIGGRIAHEAGKFGQEVRVAVLDTGIDYTHPDLMLRYAGGYDFVFDDADPMDDNTNSHGTHAAGIIAAELNGQGVVGVAPRARIYGVKVLDGAGFGSLAWLLQGIDWAIANQMHIINLSLAFDLDSPAIRDACDRAYAAGILLVAAAGNTGGGTVQFPAAYESVIAVNATDASDQFAAFSAIDGRVELAAPGRSIVSAARGNQYRSLDGTSQAAPHVAGVAALLMAAGIQDANGNGRINDEVRLRLRQSAVDLGSNGHDLYFGYGRVDAAAALGLGGTAPGRDKKDKKDKKPTKAGLIKPGR